MSRIRANKITNKVGTGAIELEKGAHIPVGMGITGAGAINISGAITGGVITGSSFSGDGSGLIGVASTDNIITGTAATFNTMPVDINAGMTVTGVSTMAAITATTGTFSGNVSIGGTLTYEDVTNIDSVGVVTARNGVKTNVSPAVTIRNGATEKGYIGYNGNDPFIGRKDGVGLSFQNNKIRPVDGDDGSPTTNTADIGEPTYKFKDAYFAGTVTAASYAGDGSALTGIAVGVTTEALVKTNGQTATLDLSKDDHKVTATGTVTIDVTGGTEADSHTLRIVNSGIATVGFSTYFLFPSGGVPNLPTVSGSISLISFTVHRAGAVGVSTQLLSGASVNFS